MVADQFAGEEREAGLVPIDAKEVENPIADINGLIYPTTDVEFFYLYLLAFLLDCIIPCCHFLAAYPVSQAPFWGSEYYYERMATGNDRHKIAITQL